MLIYNHKGTYNVVFTCDIKLVVQMVKIPPAMRETWVRSMGWEDPLEEGMAKPTLVFLPGESPWTEEPGRLQSMGSKRVGQNWATEHNTHIKHEYKIIIHTYSMLFCNLLLLPIFKNLNAIFIDDVSLIMFVCYSAPWIYHTSLFIPFNFQVVVLLPVKNYALFKTLSPQFFLDMYKGFISLFL